MNRTDEARKCRGRTTGRLLLFALIAITAGVFVYPHWADAVSDCRQMVVIDGYTQQTDALTQSEKGRLFREAVSYNQMLWNSRQETLFAYEGENYEDAVYDALLVTSPFSSVMGYVEIPATGAYVPIVHGTRSEDLTYQAGHLHGTSLPVGGKNTHCVISAHTGLKTAQLFTGIDRLAEGDEVLLHVLHEIRRYRVCAKTVVRPQETEAFLQIEEGKDLLTLYTCTPYGINSHRLLVKCEADGVLSEETVPEQKTAEIRNGRALLRAVGWGALPVLLFAVGLLLVFSRKGCVLVNRFFCIPSGEDTRRKNE